MVAIFIAKKYARGVSYIGILLKVKAHMRTQSVLLKNALASELLKLIVRAVLTIELSKFRDHFISFAEFFIQFLSFTAPLVFGITEKKE